MSRTLRVETSSTYICMIASTKRFLAALIPLEQLGLELAVPVPRNQQLQRAHPPLEQSLLIAVRVSAPPRVRS
jgi:hypothetical protein